MIRHLFLGYRGLSRPASVFSMMMMMMMMNYWIWAVVIKHFNCTLKFPIVKSRSVQGIWVSNTKAAWWEWCGLWHFTYKKDVKMQFQDVKWQNLAAINEWESFNSTSQHARPFSSINLSVTVEWLAVKTASEMTYTVSGGALNSAQSISTINVSSYKTNSGRNKTHENTEYYKKTSATTTTTNS